MRLRPCCWFVGACQLAVMASAASTDPDPLDTRSFPALKNTAVSSDPRGRSLVAKGPLPDPALLDGSKQPAEKQSDYGMLGEFEIPGSDEKGDKSGDQSQQGGGGGGSNSDQSQSAKSGGGGGQQQSAQSQQGGAQGGGGAQSASASGAQGKGGSAGGQQSQQNGGSEGSIAQNEPNASAQGGVESSNLSSPDGSAGSAAPQSDAPPAKPGAQKIGDASMQIKTVASSSAPSVIGVQQPVTGKDTPQQYDPRTPGGRGTNGGSNKGTEKGQSMPTGL
jgi:hypothetical protein